IQVITGYAPGNIRKFIPDFIGIFVAQITQLLINLAFAAALPDNFFQLLFTCGTHFHFYAIIGKYRQRLGIIGGTSTVASFSAITEWMPQELFPNMPPRAQWLWVAGSGPKVRSASSFV